MSFFIPQTCEKALPRTVALVTAGAGFTTGAYLGGGVLAALLQIGSNHSDPKAAAIILAGGAVVGSAAALAGYAAGYGGANVFMAAFPAVKPIKSKLLAPPSDKRVQAAFFAAGAVYPLVGLGLRPY